jgi:hypothetical protein
LTLPGGLGRWLVGLAAVGLLVVVVTIVAGGGSKAGGPRFRQFATSGLTGLVPVGWSGGAATSAPAGTVKAAFDEPRQPDFRLVVTVERPAPGTDRLQAARLRAAGLRRLAMTRLGYVEHFFGRILFPGGRPAWLLSYESDGFSHATYIDTACKPGVAMTVEISAPDRSKLTGIAEPIAASSGPQCG